METEIYSHIDGKRELAWRKMLQKACLTAENIPEKTAFICDGGEIVATASRDGSVLKYFAVDDAHKGEDLAAKLVSALRADAFDAGIEHLFIYTLPEKQRYFENLFFYPVTSTKNVALLENKKNGITEFLNSFNIEISGDNVGAAVMNCDPFTLGHRYLIETAAKACDELIVFVLSEENGLLCARDRFALVCAACADIANVKVVQSGPYLLSRATFPTYFIADRDSAPAVQCELDVKIFTEFFAKKFNIKKRFVGSELLSAATAKYNEILAKNLPEAGIELCEIPRKEYYGEPISASSVRKAVCEGKIDSIKDIVPPETYRFLKSRER